MSPKVAAILQELGVYIDNYAMGYYVRTVQRLMRENSKMENKEMKIINQDAKYKMGNLRRQQNELFAKEVAEWTRNHQMRQLILQQLVRYSTTDSTDVSHIQPACCCWSLLGVSCMQESDPLSQRMHAGVTHCVKHASLSALGSTENIMHIMTEALIFLCEHL